MTLGGFSGSDPAPSTRQLAGLIRSGEVRYVLLAFPEGSPAAKTRSQWVASRCALTGVPYLAPGQVAARRMGAGRAGGRGPNSHSHGAGVSAGLYLCADVGESQPSG